MALRAAERHFSSSKVYGVTFNVNWKELVTEDAPTTLPLTVTLYAPVGVPGFLLLPLEVPPQPDIQRVESPTTVTKAKIRMLLTKRLRGVIANTIPKKPGNKTA